MADIILWADVPERQRRTWRWQQPGDCPAAARISWFGNRKHDPPTYAPCYGYVKPGNVWCWAHDPEHRTPEFKSRQREKQEHKRALYGGAPVVCGWVGEAEYLP